jgi:RES domain
VRQSDDEFETWLRNSIDANRSSASEKGWRAVEAQHVVSTLRITNNDPDQQELLERILEESKPPLPSEAAQLHYLLATPFRYPPLPYGSRFRAWPDPGVLYAAFERRTACAEMGYWRWRFLMDSEGIREIPASPQTVFQLGARGPALDLREPPFAKHSHLWTDRVNYGPTQALGRVARQADIAMVLYHSVRDIEHGACIAIMRPSALRPKRPLAQETWHLTITAQGTIWQRESQRFVFRFE